MANKSLLLQKWTKVVVLLLCLVPAAQLGWKAFHRGLGANPIEFVTHSTGDWTMIILVISLSVTPLRRILNQPELIRFRRMLGLFAFSYGSLHFITYIWLDKFFDLSEMIHDVAKRPFITAGFTGFILLIPLAVTSTTGWIRRLGGRNWQRLHKSVYVIAIAGVIHYYWLVKSDIRKPVMYGVVVFTLLAYRAGTWVKQNRIRPVMKLSSADGSRDDKQLLVRQIS